MTEKRSLLANAIEFIDQHYKERLLRLDLEFESARRRLQSDYDRLMKRRIASAAIPHVTQRHGPQVSAPPSSGNALLRFARDLYYRYYGKLPRVQPLHPYWAAMRHLVRVVDAAAQNGATNVLVVGSGAAAESAADHLAGLHAQVSLPDVVQGNLAKAFSRPPAFDLCICAMGAGELPRFADVVKAVAPTMRDGGKVVGFYPNFGLDQVSMSAIESLGSGFDFPCSLRIHYAGSAKSARVVRQFHRMLTTNKGRFAKLVQTATMLFIVSPSALAANRLEAAGHEDQLSRLPAHCTSITIEITVPHAPLA